MKYNEREKLRSMNFKNHKKTCLFGFVMLVGMLFNTSIVLIAQHEEAKRIPTLGLEEGTTVYDTDDLSIELVNASQTIKSLINKNENFDFTPGERIESRAADGFYHLGDINFRVKELGEELYKEYSTAKHREAVEPITSPEAHCLAAAKLNTTLPDDCPLEIIRLWVKENNHLALKFQIKNTTNKSIEIGALGIPVIFNNNIDGKTLDQAHTENVFFDPYIGMDAGYLQVIRLHGNGNPLLVLPLKNSPFEAYRPLLDEPTPRGITFEGFHEWMIHSKAYAKKEWKNATPWNKPTSKVLKPGEKYEVGLAFVVASSVKDIENTLIANNRPVAQGIPGYVLPKDVNGKLFLKYQKEIKEIRCEPKEALSFTFSKTTEHGWKEYEVKGNQWGRARATIIYADGLQQTINYKVIKSETEVVADNGHFLTTEQWFDKEGDLFHRAPSPITYDYETKKQVTQDSRSWIAGLSDEGGAGAWLNAVMKQLVLPDPDEVAKMEEFVHKTMWGGIQFKDGAHKYGVRKSMFYYEPDSMPKGTYNDTINYNTWAAWSKEASEDVGRSYNYPHVAAAYWVMYRLGRYYEGLVKKESWEWYLNQAYHTTMAMVNQAPHYAQFGQMEGSVFLLILKDLQKEGLKEMASTLEDAMKKRALHWASLNYPFGSEMPWDSTGQEEVYMWSHYFGFSDKAAVTLNAILAYMPTIPHWAYNGNARRYWDFWFGGKLSRVERQIHHYGSALNAIPVLNEYKLNPDDFYLLKVGYGGVMGAIANITEDGFAPCAFHSFPSTLKNDGISGDYGTGFYGYAVNTSSYLIHHKEFGWLAFGGNVSEKGNWINTELTTAAKSKFFIAEQNLWLTLDAGQFYKVKYNSLTKEIYIIFAAQSKFNTTAYLNIADFGNNTSSYTVKGYKKDEKGTYEIELKNKPVEVVLIKEK